MSPFNAKTGLVFVEAEVSGPAGMAGATLVLDTGATSTTLNRTLPRVIGYDPDAEVESTLMATGSAGIRVPRLSVNRLSALGRHTVGLRVMTHNLPPEAAVDGLLGLDFFRGHCLTVDFRGGLIDLT